MLRLFTALCFATLACGAAFAVDPISHVFKKVADRELTLNAFNPPDWKPTDQRPAIVFFHGGGWVGGTPKQFLKHCEYLSTRGMVAIEADYRHIPKGDKGPPTDCVHDAKSAVRWVRSHAKELGIDPNRIAAGGGSAGGHLAAFVGTVDGLDDPADDLKVSAKANALALFNPVFDNGPDQGWGRERVGDRFKEFSPAHNISKDDPPAIIFLGTQDKLIPVSVVERFKANMEKAGGRCEAKFYEGQGHGFFNPGKGGTDEYFYQTLLETDKFLISLGWLKGEPTLKHP